MPITIEELKAQFTRGNLSKLSELCGPHQSVEAQQILTRFDFQNRRFKNIGSLKAEMSSEQEGLPHWIKVPTSDKEIAKAVEGNLIKQVVLVRGTTQQSAQAAILAKSAGGDPVNYSVARPTESEAISQVGGSQVGRAQVKLPEFTPSLRIADKWAKRGGFFFIKISSSYLTRGDVGQEGWVVHKSAPIFDGFFFPHPNPVNFSIANAD